MDNQSIKDVESSAVADFFSLLNRWDREDKQRPHDAKKNARKTDEEETNDRKCTK